MAIERLYKLGPAEIGVLSERQRQISDEGWTPEHDDTHCEGELACAAAAYAMPEWLTEWMDKNDIKIWPFEGRPNFKNRIRDLERAGALILAEIDRVRREMERNADAPSECPLCGKAEAHTHEM